MEMTIDESMKVLQEVPKVMPITKESIDVAIETMNKYQKIKEIVGNYGFDTSWLCLKKIREVMEDGNDDNQRLQNAT